MPMISIRDTASGSAGGPRPAYLAEPVPVSDRQGPWPGVIVVHDAFGLGDDIREQADWLAASGYIALAPDLYNGKSMVRCIKGIATQLMAQQGAVFRQIEVARSHLAGLPTCTGTVGVIGYCFGGAFALLLAARPGYSAAAVNYGQLPKNLDEVLSGSCPMVASFGGRDPVLKGAAEKVRLGLRAAGVPSDVKEYPNAGHGFINRSVALSPLNLIMRVAGVGHEHESAADAKKRILEFFDLHLRASESMTAAIAEGRA